jgi:hypothetical protein
MQAPNEQADHSLSFCPDHGIESAAPHPGPEAYQPGIFNIEHLLPITNYQMASSK